MKSKATPPWWKQLAFLKDWWWLIGLVTGGIVLWGNLPARMAKAEQKNEHQDEEIIDLKGLSKKLDGYLESQQETNQRLMNLQQQQRQQPVASPSSASRASQAYQPPRETTWVERDEDGSCWRCIASTEEQCWEDDPKTPEVDNHWRRCPDDARTP